MATTVVTPDPETMPLEELRRLADVEANKQTTTPIVIEEKQTPTVEVTTKDEETAFDTDSFTDKEKTSDFNFNLGAGIKWNNLDFDLTLNEAFPLSGGYILSGDQETPATRASATYHF